MSTEKTPDVVALATIAPTKSQAMIAGVDEQLLDFFESDAGKGTEKASMQDKSIPFLGVLQDLSPQVKKTEAKYIKGAEIGMFFNSVSKEVFPGEVGVNVIPVDFQKKYNVWRQRKAGGGFRGSFDSKRQAEAKIQQLVALKEGAADQYDIVDTALHFVLQQDHEGVFKPALFSLKSTHLRASREWISAIEDLRLDGRNGKYNPPSYACIYTVTTRIERKDQNSWYVPVIERTGLVSKELFVMAKALYESLSKGEVEVNFENEAGAEVKDDSQFAGKF